MYLRRTERLRIIRPSRQVAIPAASVLAVPERSRNVDLSLSQYMVAAEGINHVGGMKLRDFVVPHERAIIHRLREVAACCSQRFKAVVSTRSKRYESRL